MQTRQLRAACEKRSHQITFVFISREMYLHIPCTISITVSFHSYCQHPCYLQMLWHISISTSFIVIRSHLDQNEINSLRFAHWVVDFIHIPASIHPQFSQGECCFSLHQMANDYNLCPCAHFMTNCTDISRSHTQKDAQKCQPMNIYRCWTHKKYPLCLTLCTLLKFKYQFDSDEILLYLHQPKYMCSLIQFQVN